MFSRWWRHVTIKIYSVSLFSINHYVIVFYVWTLMVIHVMIYMGAKKSVHKHSNDILSVLPVIRFSKNYNSKDYFFENTRQKCTLPQIAFYTLILGGHMSSPATVMLVTTLCLWLHDNGSFIMLATESLCWLLFQCKKSVFSMLSPTETVTNIRHYLSVASM